MEQNQALDILVQAVNIAHERGAYKLAEAGLVAQAVAVFTSPAKEKKGPDPTVVAEEPGDKEENEDDDEEEEEVPPKTKSRWFSRGSVFARGLGIK